MTSNTEIEEELTSYLKSLAGSPEDIPLAAHHPCNNQTDTSSPPREVNPYLKDILSLEPSLEEIHNTISDLDNSASAWELSPRLIKLTANTTWTVPTRKGKKRLKREARRHQWELAQGITPQTSPVPQTYNKTYTAERAVNVLRMIVTLSFQSGDIPPSEKFGRLTGLPKAEGPLNSTDCMRPMTVSPIINRPRHQQRTGQAPGSSTCKTQDPRSSTILFPPRTKHTPGDRIHPPLSPQIQTFREQQPRQSVLCCFL